jgi:Radical SAM superfamily
VSSPLTAAERLKFRLLADGLTITSRALATLAELNGGRQLTPADFASTSGVILRLEDDVWVNAPISAYNPNFVHAPPYVLDLDAGGFAVRGDSLESRAWFWLSPSYHGESLAPSGRRHNYYAFTHGDRVRLAPIQGCAMRCQFCNVPYEDRYALKDVDEMLDAARLALDDPIQPARHVLVSGGTPVPRDVVFLRMVYERVLQEFPFTQIDIMMVPVEGLFDLHRLRDLGVHELSINLELHDDDRARALMPQKYLQGERRYLDFIAAAAEVLGPRRVRSMLMVGLEPRDNTLAGVRAIAERGGLPVLSPFRPDPVTPLRGWSPPSAAELEETYLRAMEIAEAAGTYLGPTCLPCTHNTVTLASALPQPATYEHKLPAMV